MQRFKLEFNEQQQKFHHNYGLQSEVEGWETICDSCNDEEFHLLEAYICRKPEYEYSFGKAGKKKLTCQLIAESIREIQSFYDNLHDYDMTIDTICKGEKINVKLKLFSVVEDK